MHVRVILTLNEAEELISAASAWVAECRRVHGSRNARVLGNALRKVQLALGVLGRWRSSWPREEGES